MAVKQQKRAFAIPIVECQHQCTKLLQLEGEVVDQPF